MRIADRAGISEMKHLLAKFGFRDYRIFIGCPAR
jgi:hypothetical protein